MWEIKTSWKDKLFLVFGVVCLSPIALGAIVVASPYLLGYMLFKILLWTCEWLSKVILSVWDKFKQPLLVVGTCAIVGAIIGIISYWTRAGFAFGSLFGIAIGLIIEVIRGECGDNNLYYDGKTLPKWRQPTSYAYDDGNYSVIGNGGSNRKITSYKPVGNGGSETKTKKPYPWTWNGFQVTLGPKEDAMLTD